MNAQTLQTLRRAAQTAAAATFVALGLPAVAGEVTFGAGITAAERVRAADNGSADVMVAVPTAGTVANAALGASEAATADRRAPAGLVAERRAPVGMTAERRAPVGMTAERRAPVGMTAERRAPVGLIAE